MALAAAKCTQCGAGLDVDPGKDAALARDIEQRESRIKNSEAAIHFLQHHMEVVRNAV